MTKKPKHKRVRIFMDGNSWCALLGHNLQEGYCGFGATPAEARYRLMLDRKKGRL